MHDISIAMIKRETLSKPLSSFKNTQCSGQTFSIAEVSRECSLRTLKEQLYNATKARKSVIVVKDKEFGRRLVLWMTFGRGVHNSAIGMATASLMCAATMNEKFMEFAKPLAIGSIALNFAYHTFWHQTPIMDYRIASSCSLLHVNQNDAKTHTIVVEKTEKHKTHFACSLSLVASTVAFWRGIKPLNFTKSLFSIFK